MTIDKQALAIPQREKHDWSQAVMRDCEFCQQWALTVKHSDGGCICASCCDSEYTTALSSALVVVLDELEAAEKRIAETNQRNAELTAKIEPMDRRIAELEARTVTLPDRKSELFWPGYGFEFDNLGYVIAVKDAIRAAGIGVKGE